jgi:WD40 repeat protein/serine/threonine protein kinase
MNEGPSGTVLRPGSGFKPSATAGPGRKSSDLDSFQEINPGRTWEPGEIIEGRYQVINELTGGAMGQVYRVKHKTWNIELAIKSPQPHLIANEALKTRFIQEAESWVELGLHPHITTCYYVTQIEGIPRIVLEYVEGGTLKQWIARGAFFQDWEAPLGVAIQFCLGLEYAHSKGVVHRDLKPANVLMTKEGTPKLTDFGLVKRGSGTDYQGSLGNTGSSAFDPPYQGGTMVGTVLGTPEYMAPEQWIGAEQTGTHTDIYAVGVVLYELFCGRRPFEISESLQYAHPSLQEREWKRMHTEEPIPNPHQWRPDIPESLVILLRECLAKAPSDRPISVTAVRERLEVTYQIHLGRTAPYTQAAAGLDFRADNLNNRALSYMDLGKEAEAEAIWRDALAADPQHAEVIYNLGVFLWRRGRLTDNALVRQLEEVRATHSNQWQAMYLLALVQLERGEAELAYLLLGEAVRRTSGEAELQAPLQMARSRVFTTRRFTKSFEGHSNSVSSVCISKDGRWALSGSADTTLRLWDISTGQCVRVFHGHNNYVSSVSMSADGRLALSGSSDNTLQLWEVATGRRMRTFEGHLKGITSVSLSADGRLGLSGSWDKTIQLWDIVTGIWLKTFEGHTKEVLSVSLSADGRWALSGSSDNTVQLWDITTGQSLRTFKGHTREVTVVCLSPDGRWALSGSSDKTIMLWDTVKGQCVRTFEGHTNSVTSLYISAEGRWILSGSRDNTLRLWEVATGRCLRTFQGHTDWVTSVCLSPDGNWALSGSGDHTLRLWKLPRDTACIPRLSRPRSHKEWLEVQTRSGALLKKAGEALEKMNYSEALHLVQEARQVPGCERTPQSMEAWTKLSLICPRIGLRSAWLARTFEKSENEINAISMSTDGQLAISGGGNDIQVWDVATGRCLRSFPGHANSVLCVYMSPDGRWALSGGGDNVMRLWDVTTGRCVRAFQGHIHWVRSVRLSPDGRWALSCGGNSILLWEVNTGRCARTFLGHTNSVLSVSWSEDGRWVLSGGGDNTIRLWDVATGRCIRTFQGHTSWVRSVCFSTDGRWILSGGADNTVRLWQTETGNCLKVFQEHTDGVNSVCLSADGRWAFSGGSDSTVRFWQLSKGDQTRVFRGHASWVRSVCISSDGRWVLSGGGDKMIRLWQMDWELEARDLATWNEGALPFLKTFLTLHTPYTSTDLSKPEGFTRSGKPSWNEQEFEGLIRQLQQAGYGRLRHEGVRAKLEELARE